MAFENLTQKLEEALKSLKGKGKIEEDDLKQALRQVRLAMIEADVNLGVVKDFINNIKEKAIGQEIYGNLNPVQTVIKIVKDELTDLLGGVQSGITIPPNRRQ